MLFWRNPHLYGVRFHWHGADVIRIAITMSSVIFDDIRKKTIPIDV